MKKILFAIVALFSMTLCAEENTFKISSSNIDEAKAGNTATLIVKLDKNFPISGYSFLLGLPDGITIAKKSHIVLLEDRDPNEEFSLTFMNAKEGKKLISHVNPTGGSFEGDNGELLNITLTIADTVEEGIYKITFDEISVTTPDAVGYLQDGFYVEIGVGMKTAINSIEAASENENAPMYNLAGQRVSRVQKGIFIQNGKKVLK